MIAEIGDGLVGGLEKAVRLWLERELHAASGLIFERDEMGGDAQHVIGIARNHVVAGDPRLETQRRTLDRRRDAGRQRRRARWRLMVYCVRSSPRQSGS